MTDHDPGGRWKVACINWTNPTAPQALAYYVPSTGWEDRLPMRGRYFSTWAAAVAYVDRMCRLRVALNGPRRRPRS